MFITVSVGGMLAVAATSAATGVVAALYVRNKTMKAVSKARSIVSTLSNGDSARPWRALVKKVSIKYPPQ